MPLKCSCESQKFEKLVSSLLHARMYSSGVLSAIWYPNVPTICGQVENFLYSDSMDDMMINMIWNVEDGL